MAIKEKKIVLGVTGSIAAYKSVFLLRELKKRGANVHVIMTKSALKFVSPLTFKALSGNRVHVDMFDDEETSISHINLEEDADLFVIAPATANIIGKVASGIADDFLSTFAMAVNAETLIAPSMNCNMYNNIVLQNNIKKLKACGVHFIGPEVGELACKKEDIGRLSDIDDIVEMIEDLLTEKALKGKRVLVSAGPTVEDIDPVRYITNRSTGKMGYAIAKMAKRRGAEVTLVSGPVNLKPINGVTMVYVKSAHDMHKAIMINFDDNDILIMAAACADFTVENFSKQKIKKGEKKDIILKLKRTADILLEVSKVNDGKIVVGFAAESEKLKENAIKKLRKKKLNFIVANDITRKDAGFGADTNAATIIDNNEDAIHFDVMSKDALAEEIINKIAGIIKD